ncbi:MAG: UV DNA damage repair endonuclease UvsE [Clostridiaceae bacterium]
MRIGYACIALAVEGTDLKSCTMKNVSPERLLSLVCHNLRALSAMIDYNIKNNILLYRISSDLVPFGSSLAKDLPWEAENEPLLCSIREKIAASGMRVSMHPGQYTVLNSPDADVVRRAADDLRYHARVLDSLAPGQEHKIVLHAGGKYGEPASAMRRFVSAYRDLDASVTRRLVLENDGSIYTIAEALELSSSIGAPVIYDNLHNALNPADIETDDTYWIAQAAPTWSAADGPQKLHYSQQHPIKTHGAHSDFIAIDPFLEYCHRLPNPSVDIMLEVKDKNLSALKCILCTSQHPVSALEAEWAKYKYSILEKSPAAYQEIRELLKNKQSVSAPEFYRMVESALALSEDAGRAENALEHVWGYFTNLATPAEQARYRQRLSRYLEGSIPLAQVKNTLRSLAEAYKITYLTDSYYFTI